MRVADPSNSRAALAALAAVLAVSCVLLVISADDQQEIVASGVDVHAEKVLKSRLRKEAAQIGRRQKIPGVEKLPVIGWGKGHAAKAAKKAAKKKESLLHRNLVDLKAFIVVNKDNILDMGSEDLGIVKSMATIILEAKQKDLVKAWKKFVKKKEHEFSLKFSLAGNMIRVLDKQLHSKKGVLSIHNAKVAITGPQVGLLETPHQWDEKMTASLPKVLNEAKKLGRDEISLRKKKSVGPSYSQKDYDTLFKTKCVNLQAANNFHMGCHEATTQKTCHQKPGCQWQKGWTGDLAVTTAVPVHVEAGVTSEDWNDELGIN